MIVFITSAISVMLLATVCYQIFKDASAANVPKDRTSYVILLSGMLTLGVGVISDTMSVSMLMLEIGCVLTGMLLMKSSLWERKVIRPVSLSFGVLSLFPIIIHISVAAGWISIPDDRLLSLLYLVPVFAVTGFFIFGLIRRLRDVKEIMKNGTVWTNVCMAVDAIYVVSFLLLSVCYIPMSLLCPDRLGDCLLIFPLLLGLMLAALGIREADDVLFIFWRKQERRIVESMKITKVETAVDPCNIDAIYQDIYERVVAYFETEKPFLDNALTINDLVKVLYSNKLYVSRAISQFTGRNFCQFVNYYRVAYSLEMFRNNTDLKIHELACGSGFNSDVSYNMAFRLFMGETPGEWCRKERNRKIKMKK